FFEMTSETPSEILLRAEIRSAKETVVSYARELTSTSVFVVTDWRPPVATEVHLRISFPTLVEPVDVEARVHEHRPALGVGRPAGLEFHFDSAGARATVERLLARIGRGETASSPALRTTRVLLVEDNGFIRDMFAYGIGKFFAQRRGEVRFDHAEDAAKAREMLEAAAYDLVIVDYYLPSEDGAAFISRLRRDPRFARSPVVAISVGGRDAREATLSAGADLFLDKPVVLRDLFQTLQLLAQRGSLA
ncbi:MAG: response regulator, partial [Polyangiaceae bacterium]